MARDEDVFDDQYDYNSRLDRNSSHSHYNNQHRSLRNNLNHDTESGSEYDVRERGGEGEGEGERGNGINSTSQFVSLIAIAVISFDFMCTFFVIPLFWVSLGGSFAFYGLIFGLYSFARALGAPLTGMRGGREILGYSI